MIVAPDGLEVERRAEVAVLVDVEAVHAVGDAAHRGLDRHEERRELSITTSPVMADVAPRSVATAPVNAWSARASGHAAAKIKIFIVARPTGLRSPGQRFCTAWPHHEGAFYARWAALRRQEDRLTKLLFALGPLARAAPVGRLEFDSALARAATSFCLEQRLPAPTLADGTVDEAAARVAAAHEGRGAVHAPHRRHRAACVSDAQYARRWARRPGFGAGVEPVGDGETADGADAAEARADRAFARSVERARARARAREALEIAGAARGAPSLEARSAWLLRVAQARWGAERERLGACLADALGEHHDDGDSARAEGAPRREFVRDKRNGALWIVVHAKASDAERLSHTAAAARSTPRTRSPAELQIDAQLLVDAGARARRRARERVDRAGRGARARARERDPRGRRRRRAAAAAATSSTSRCGSRPATRAARARGRAHARAARGGRARRRSGGARARARSWRARARARARARRGARAPRAPRAHARDEAAARARLDAEAGANLTDAGFRRAGAAAARARARAARRRRRRGPHRAARRAARARGRLARFPSAGRRRGRRRRRRGRRRRARRGGRRRPGDRRGGRRGRRVGRLLARRRRRRIGGAGAGRAGRARRRRRRRPRRRADAALAAARHAAPVTVVHVASCARDDAQLGGAVDHADVPPGQAAGHGAPAQGREARGRRGRLGLDYFSCFFYDSETDVEFDRDSLYRDVSHRKVIEYVGFADEVAGEVGDHGTHVAGSIMGGVASADDGGGIDDDQLVTAAHRFDGMAFEGKMAFFDIGEAGQPFLNVPGALEDSMFPFVYDMGARLHSNSWGASFSNSSQRQRGFSVAAVDTRGRTRLPRARRRGQLGWAPARSARRRPPSRA